MEKVIVTLIVAFSGGIVGIKLKIPAGAMIGAMIAVAIYNMISSKGAIPNNFKLIAQMVVGGMIGLNFTKESVQELKQIIGPAIILIVGFMLVCVTLGYLIHKLTGMDLITALFSTSPGGLTDMSLIADAYGADITKVVVLHAVRLTSVVTILPIIIKYLVEKIV